MLKDWTNREAASLGLLVSALSIAAGLASRSVGWGVVCFLLLAGIVVFCQPRMAELWSRFSLRKRAALKRAASETAAERIRQEKKRAEWWEPCRAWEEFSYDAGRLVSEMDSFRFDGEPRNWQTIMVLKAQLALLLARALHPLHRSTAEKLVRPFGKLRPDKASANHCVSDTHHLREFLETASSFYRCRGDVIGFRPTRYTPAPRR
jgi:hypothetical protein